MDELSEHAALPVRKGEKWLTNLWGKWLKASFISLSQRVRPYINLCMNALHKQCGIQTDDKLKNSAAVVKKCVVLFKLSPVH